MYNDENREFDPVGGDLPPQPQQDRTDLSEEEPDEIVSWYTPGRRSRRRSSTTSSSSAPYLRTSGSRPPRPSASAAVCGRGWA